VDLAKECGITKGPKGISGRIQSTRRQLLARRLTPDDYFHKDGSAWVGSPDKINELLKEVKK
jgi:hypothetical protein